MREELETALKAAQASSLILSKKLKKAHNLSPKKGEGRKGYFLKEDRECEEVIRKILSKDFPNYNFQGEESGLSRKPEESEFTWFVDPLCGTIEYSRRLNTFSTSVGLAKKGKPVVGVVSNPALGETFWASEGDGAFLNGERIKCSKTRELREAIVSIDHKSLRDRLFPEKLGGIVDEALRVRMGGSCGQELCFLARGRTDVLVKCKQETADYAAGSCIAIEAGARVTNFGGKKINCPEMEGRHFNLLATNGLLHAKMVSELAEKK
jgi:fructose-1,6-bisphosphatase/inositol monophosphatase family enzyme